MSSASLVRDCDCVMLIVADRSECDAAPRGSDYRSHSFPRSLIPRWSKSFGKGLPEQARDHRRHSPSHGTHISCVLYDIRVSFFSLVDQSLPLFCLTNVKTRLLEALTRQTK